MAMMRYSEITRDFSSDSLRNFDNYKNLREESPPSDLSNRSGQHLKRNSLTTLSCHHRNSQQQQQNQNHFNQHHPTVATTNNRQLNYDDGSLAAQNFNNHTTPRNSFKCDSSRMSTAFQSNGNNNGAATLSHDIRSRRDSTNSAQSWELVNGVEVLPNVKTKSASKTMNIKSNRRKNSIGCLNTLSSSPGSPGCYSCVSNPSTAPGKSRSLPAHASIQNFDYVNFNVLRIPADELANQITLLDFPVFAAIQPDELTSCAWIKKDKLTITPNIVAFKNRFNHTSFLTSKEILSGEKPKQRAEILTHFIKVAKKLHELNNLHSLHAITSAMQSVSIYRLKKTWACVSKKDKQSLDRLCEIFSEHNNWENQRNYLESLRLPLIPFLGLFLTDLIHIDAAHPHKGGLEPEQRRNKMNNILRIIANYQQSDYGYIQPIKSTQQYLTSTHYIEELQHFFEDEQYKKSHQLEPPSPSGPSSSSCSSKESFNTDAITPALNCLNVSPAKTTGSMRLSASAIKQNLTGGCKKPGHRKTQSLGTNIFNSHGKPGDFPYDFTIIAHPLHPLDDSVLEHHNTILGVVAGYGSDAASLDSAEGVLCSDMERLCSTIDAQNCFEGCVRRKTIQKYGKRPTVASWQRYWLQMLDNSLFYYSPKSFKGNSREDFKSAPCKECKLDGWYARVLENTKDKNSFELYHPVNKIIYKFRTDTAQQTQLWTIYISKITIPKPLPINLMIFD